MVQTQTNLGLNAGTSFVLVGPFYRSTGVPVYALDVSFYNQEKMSSDLT